MGFILNDYLVELKNVSVKSGSKYLLKDINWKIKKNEHWVVFGLNGSGKTTLLSMIAGFKEPTAGTIKVFGDTFTNDTILEMRKKIGWVSVSFFDNHYVKESALNIVLSGKSGTLGLDINITLDDVYRAKQLLKEFCLGDKINYPFHLFSKGERQNILIARALFSNPEILILDEPCTGLDIYNRSYLFSTIEALGENKEITIIYVTHYVEEILPLFQKTLLLKDGSIFSQGDTVKMFSNETMQGYLEYPVHIENLYDGQYRAKINVKTAIPRLLKQEEEL